MRWQHIMDSTAGKGKHQQADERQREDLFQLRQHQQDKHGGEQKLYRQRELLFQDINEHGEKNQRVRHDQL